MSGWRTSVQIQAETKFGEKPSTEKGYKFPGPGLTFNYSNKNGYRPIYGIGGRFMETETIGRFGGNWSMNLILDYDNHEWMNMVFDSKTGDAPMEKWDITNGGTTGSFTFKIRKINNLVKGSTGKNQTIYLLGCICNRCSLSYESGQNSSVRVSLSGVYVNEMQTLDTTNNVTEYPSNTAFNPVEWGCLHIGSQSVANTEKVGLSINMSKGTVPTCGSRIDSAFYEGTYDISGDTTIYSNDPTKWYERLYGANDAETIQPNTRTITPVQTMTITSKNGNNEKFTNSCDVEMTNVWVESMNTNYSPNSEITENIGLKVRKVSINIKTTAKTDPSAMSISE